MIKSKSELKRLIEQATVQRPKTTDEKGKSVFVNDDPTFMEVSLKDKFTVGVNAKSEGQARDFAYETLERTYFPGQNKNQ